MEEYVNFRKNIYFLLISVVILSGCDKNPIGDFFKKGNHHKYESRSSFIGTKISNVELDAVRNGKIEKIKFFKYKGKWLLLFFYPADFSPIFPDEFKELSDYYNDFKKEGVEILSVSTDSVYVHQAWYSSNSVIKKVKFPLISDRAGEFSRSLGVYIKEKGTSEKAIFLVDGSGEIVTYEVYNQNIKRKGREILDRIHGAKAIIKDSTRRRNSNNDDDDFEEYGEEEDE